MGAGARAIFFRIYKKKKNVLLICFPSILRRAVKQQSVTGVRPKKKKENPFGRELEVGVKERYRDLLQGCNWVILLTFLFISSSSFKIILPCM